MFPQTQSMAWFIHIAHYLLSKLTVAELTWEDFGMCSQMTVDMADKIWNF